jgi:hypothetical protein
VYLPLPFAFVLLLRASLLFFIAREGAFYFSEEVLDLFYQSELADEQPAAFDIGTMRLYGDV